MIVVVVYGCRGGGTGDPVAEIDDPRAYAIESLQTMDLNTWWEPYRDRDPELLGQIVDKAADGRPGGLPTDASQLDTFIRNRIAPGYKLRMDDTEEGRAFILAQAEARFADPPMAAWDKAGRYALLDFHSLPGEWQSVTRVGEGMVHPPAIGTQPFLKTDVLTRSLQSLAAAFPDAQAYQIRYQFHHGSRLQKMLIEFKPGQQIVYKPYGEVVFSREAVEWDDLVSGRIDLAELDWETATEDESAPPIALPPDDPLPSR
jgi:hypothetical protein